MWKGKRVVGGNVAGILPQSPDGGDIAPFLDHPGMRPDINRKAQVRILDNFFLLRLLYHYMAAAGRARRLA